MQTEGNEKPRKRIPPEVKAGVRHRLEEGKLPEEVVEWVRSQGVSAKGAERLVSRIDDEMQDLRASERGSDQPEDAQKPGEWPLSRVIRYAAIVFVLLVLAWGGFVTLVLHKGAQIEAAQIEMAQTGARTIRQAVQSWQNANNDTSCPTIEQLVHDKDLDSAVNTKDPWNEPYTIQCTDDDVIVRSNGPDRKSGTKDDIQVDRSTQQRG